MNKRAFNLITAGLGLACAAWLLWLWRANEEHSLDAGNVTMTAPEPLPPATTTARLQREPALTVAAAEWLANLHRDLLRRDVRPQEAVLAFKDDRAFQEFLARAHAAGLAVLGRIDALRTVRIRFDQAGALRADVVQHAGDYAGAGANPLIMIPQPPPAENRGAVENVPFGNRTLAFLGATENGDWGRGVTIAILDSGVAADRTFGGRLHSLDIGLGPTPGSGAADGHGTSVAALAAGAADDARGVAPAANILSIRVTDTDGLSDLFTLSKAIVAAVDTGARVINISLGGYATGAVLDAALAYAGERGAVIVAAAGNDQAARLAWPAADSRVVSVGSVDAAGQQVSFSNSGEQLQLTAPGYSVQTAWLDGQRAYVSGTSASAPLVSGAMAAVLSQNPGLTATQAAHVLLQTANEAGTPGGDPAYGQGILNVGWAMHRNDPAYVDTALASQAYDPATNQMQVGIQNRSGRMITGLTLTVTAGATATTQTVPSLAPGETYTARLPVDQIALRSNGTLSFTSRLANPPGIADRVPANNERSTILRAPAKPEP